jgi:transposase
MIKINKALYDCFTVADLKSNERQMFQWLLGKTAGYNRREVNMNINQIAKDIGRSRFFVYNSLNRPARF